MDETKNQFIPMINHWVFLDDIIKKANKLGIPENKNGLPIYAKRNGDISRWKK